MKTIFALTATAAFAGLIAFSTPALAIGGGSSGQPECPRGQVYDQTKQQCVQAESGVVDDQSLVDYAYYLAREGQYQEALDMLDLMQDPNTPEALNYRGYATRHLGRVEEGIEYYLQAVALDPDYTLVREYLGEAYVMQGQLDLAREQLQEIEQRCGTTCEPYVDLAEAIEAAI
jgi:tetratricopeptide (TPR) repeat protein